MTATPPRDALTEFGAKYGWIIGLILTVVVSSVLSYFARIEFSGLVVQTFASLAVAIWLTFFVYLFVKLLEPLHAFSALGPWVKVSPNQPAAVGAATPTGEERIQLTLSRGIEVVQNDYMEEIGTIAKTKAMTLETLEEIEAIDARIAICRELQKLHFHIKTLRLRLLWGLIASAPLIVLASGFASLLAQTSANAVLVGLFTLFAGLFAWMFLSGSIPGEEGLWCARISEMEGKELEGIRTLIGGSASRSE